MGWCCEDLGWIWRHVDFRGTLTHMYMYQKCICPEGTPPVDVQLRESALRMDVPGAGNLTVHVETATMEPGRSDCASGDECTPYLYHLMTHYHNFRTDGILFMQPDGRHLGTTVNAITAWTQRFRVAPMVYMPISNKHNKENDCAAPPAGGCIKGWSPLFGGVGDDLTSVKRSGHSSKGCFYVSPFVVHRRPRDFYAGLWASTRRAAMCRRFEATVRAVPDHELYAAMGPQVLTQGGDGLRPEAKLPARDECGDFETKRCKMPCYCLEHIWGPLFCEPCHEMKRCEDPRFKSVCALRDLSESITDGPAVEKGSSSNPIPLAKTRAVKNSCAIF